MNDASSFADLGPSCNQRTGLRSSRSVTAAINALIARRPHLALAGDRDKLTPPRRLDLVDRELKKIYEGHGAPAAWKLHREDVGHQETPAMRGEIERFLDR
jgi:hypothetical protein